MELLRIQVTGAFMSDAGVLKSARGGSVLDAVAGLLGNRYIENGRVLVVVEDGKAYKGIGPNQGQAVPESGSWQYVKEHLDELDERERRDVTEFFFSGNWVRAEQAEDHWLEEILDS